VNLCLKCILLKQLLCCDRQVSSIRPSEETGGGSCSHGNMAKEKLHFVALGQVSESVDTVYLVYERNHAFRDEFVPAFVSEHSFSDLC